jgi:hypothetical protein
MDPIETLSIGMRFIMRCPVLAFFFLASSACIHQSSIVTPAPLDYVFDAEPSTIAPGETTTLHWNIPGAVKVTIEAAGLKDTESLQRIGTFGAIGSLKVKPAADTTYVITCEGGTTITCASLTVRIRVQH